MAHTHREDDSGIPSPYEATQGEKPLEAEIEENRAGVFPADIDAGPEIGGSPEERGALDEEFRQGS